MKSSKYHSARITNIVVRRAVFLIIALLLCILSGAAVGSDETIMPDSWVYPALRTFELAGFVELAPTLPYTRSDVERYVARILSSVEELGGHLTPRRRFLLERLETEFLGTSPHPGEREDQPLLVFEEDNAFGAFDVAVGGLYSKTAEVKKGELWGLVAPGLLVDVGRLLTVESVYRIKIGPERDGNVYGSKPSPRERSFRGVTSEYEKGVASLSGERWGVRLGRDYIHWGNGRDCGLLLSRTAGSLDHLAVNLELGRFSITMVHAILDSRLERRFAGHRLTMHLPRGIFLGIGETVVYTGRGIDYAYMLPFACFYANQYNESIDDNSLWGIDWKIPVTGGLLFYGELLIDDFQYESDPPAPDRIGCNLSVEALVTFGDREIEFLASYTYIDIFTYAHKDTLLTRYVTGNGDPVANRLIGSPLGPDADRWSVKLATPVHPRLVVSIEGSYSRSGEGSDLREWDRIEDPRPPFPSGEVIEETILAMHQNLDLGRGSLVRAGGGWRFLRGGPDCLDEDEGFFSVELLLDF
jgi:hypothetical protein